jgi:anti-anti-sigma regulatory factor
MSLAVDDTARASAPFTVTTTRCDGVRADLRVCGRLNGRGAQVLRAVLDGHLRAGRRYLRVDIGGAAALDDAALGVLCEAHRWLLAARGTLVITAVTTSLAPVLAAADPTFLTLATTATDISG